MSMKSQPQSFCNILLAITQIHILAVTHLRRFFPEYNFSNRIVYVLNLQRNDWHALAWGPTVLFNRMIIYVYYSPLLYVLQLLNDSSFRSPQIPNWQAPGVSSLIIPTIVVSILYSIHNHTDNFSNLNVAQMCLSKQDASKEIERINYPFLMTYI